MPASAAFPGLAFCLCSSVLLIFVSVSAPTWDKISFLDAGSGSSVVGFGVFGYTGSSISIGYRFNPSTLNFKCKPQHTNLTKCLILHPIAAGLAGLAFLCGVCGAFYHRAGTVVMVLLVSIATVVCLLAFLFDMVLFGIARRAFQHQGITASRYGNACWLTLGALTSLLLAFSTAACGLFGRYKKRAANAR
ncbi:pali-domain-containing protein [Mycena rebaudengoi]|nr:pali-domain-containing protein [Mycena rebaudengoi]